jgi:hypothetical protein
MESMHNKEALIATNRNRLYWLSAANLAVICCMLLNLFVPACVATSDGEATQSVRQFVEAFYDWYVPKALSSSPGPAWGSGVATRPGSFSTELASLLQKARREQAQTKGAISGLDFDPFLSTQDPDDHYNVGNIVKKGESYWVSIYGGSAERSRPPALVAEVKRADGRWRFTNFRYPSGKDLVSLLRVITHSTNAKCE